MKKFIVLAVLLLILILNSVQTKSNFSLKDYFDFGELTIYSNYKSEILPNVSMNTYKGEVIGESLFLKNYEADAILKKLNAQIKFLEYIDNLDLSIIYAYSPIISKTVELKNTSINLQIAVANDYLVVGWPMILGSF